MAWRFWALLFAACGTTGCEAQFLLVTRPQAPLGLSSTESVSRLTAPATEDSRPRAFDDPGVVTSGGTKVPYWREGQWVPTSGSLKIRVDDANAAIEFAVHPGRRDLPLLLTVGRDQLCELRKRVRPPRDAALFVATASAFLLSASLIARLDGWAKTPFSLALVATGTGVATGAGMFFWPAGEGEAGVESSCGP